MVRNVGPEENVQNRITTALEVFRDRILFAYASAASCPNWSFQSNLSTSLESKQHESINLGTSFTMNYTCSVLKELSPSIDQT